MSEASCTSATSRTNTAGKVPARIGTTSRSLMFLTTELSGTIGYLSPSITLPEGLIVLAAAMALTTSSGERLQARRRSGLTLTTMARALAPNGGGAGTPGRLGDNGRTGIKASSCHLPARGGLLERTR